MKILITGATGFVGRNLFSKMTQEHELFLLTRESSNASILAPEHEYVFTGDIDHLKEYLESEKIDGVIHLATKYVAEHESSQILDLIMSNIYLGTAVLDAASRAGVKWFLNIGTIWQNYNSPNYTDEYNPVNLYAASKQAFMTMAKFYTETSPIRFCTLKLCDTYGEGDTRRKIMDLFAENAKSGNPLDMSKGEQLIDIVHISKVFESIEQLIKRLSDPNEKVLREYVVTSGHHIPLKQLAVEYEHQHNVKLNINWGARPYRKREVMKPYLGISLDNEMIIKDKLTTLARGGG